MKSRKRKKKLLNRKSIDPQQYSFTGAEDEQAQSHSVLFEYNASSCSEELISDLSKSRLPEYGKKQWLHLRGLANVEQVLAVLRPYQLHSLHLQDILDVHQRPKFQVHEGYLFFSAQVLYLQEQEIQSEQISIICSSTWLLSFQETELPYFEHLRERLRLGKGILRERSPDYLFYLLIEALLDSYSKLLFALEQELEGFDLHFLQAESSPAVLANIQQNKKQVLFLRKLLSPLRDFLSYAEREENLLIEQRTKKYFQELLSLNLGLLDSCDLLLAQADSQTNLLFAIQSQQMNAVMKTLTVVSTVFIPLTFIAGIYGMNFDIMPELHWTWGYAFVWAVFLLLAFLMLWLFKKRNWF